jgi:Raf kinase inhibitor-like YbhB/YbcL family protein
MAFQVTVAGFAEGATIPKKHTCEGQDLSPAMGWSGAPPATRSFALIVDDPDAPVGTWNHWLLYDIPAATESLPEGVRPGPGSAPGGLSGTNDFRRPGYGGPCPPPGDGPHRYFFKLYALDVPSLKLRAGAKRADLDRALRGRVLAEAQYMGRYERK